MNEGRAIRQRRWQRWNRALPTAADQPLRLALVACWWWLLVSVMVAAGFGALKASGGW